MSALDAEQDMEFTLGGIEASAWGAHLESATTVTSIQRAWLNSDTMKLRSDQWQAKGETPSGAMQPISWSWGPSGRPRNSFHANHASAIKHAAVLGKQLDEAAAMGMVEYFDPSIHGSQDDFVTNVLPLAAIEKAPGKVRMLVDPTLPGVNECMAPLPCPLITVEEIFQHVSSTSVLGKRDLINGFFHITLDPTARAHMGFTHPVTGQVGRWTVLPQGTRQSPAIFCEVTNASARIFNRALKIQKVGAFIFIYVDDYIVIADSHDDLVKAFAIMDKEAAALGLEFNPAKDVGREAPLQELEALGIIIDATSQELRLPSDKREAYLADVLSFQQKYSSATHAPRKQLEKLVGKLVFACRTCRWGFLFIQELLDQLYPGLGTPPQLIALTQGVWFDVKFWAQTLHSPDWWSGLPKHLVGKRDTEVAPEAFTTQVWTDASKHHGVGGVMEEQDEVFSHKWDKPVDDIHIGILELKGLLLTLEHWQQPLAGHRVLAWMDNSQAVAAVNRGASRIPGMRDILLQMAQLGLAQGFTLKAKHIPGKLNPADAPSRGVHAGTWLFTQAEGYNHPPAEVDCCAASPTDLATSSCSLGITATDVGSSIPAMVGKSLWATVPIHMADTVIEAIVQAWQHAPLTTTATIVVPHWPSAKWFRKYMRRKHPLFTVVHTFPEGARIFRKLGGTANSAPAKWPVLVMQLGGSQS